jgi:CHAT domain-containing protein/predicted negative regulator of RcsB-dependent stress response
MANTNTAIEIFHTLADEAKASRLFDTLAYIQLELAAYYFDRAISFDSAIYYCDQALGSIQENKETYKTPYLKAWYDKGFYYRKWDKFEKSKEALNIVLNEAENDYTFRATWQLGKLYKDRGEFALAFKQYQKALELARDDEKKKIQVYEYIAFAYLIMDTDEGAEHAIYWLDKLEASVKSLADDSYADYLPLTHYNKASCYYQLGNLDKAETLVDEAARLLEICCDDPDFMGLILDFKGYMDYEKGNYKSAIDKYKKGIDLFQYSYDLGRGEGLAGSYYAIAEAFMRWGQLDSAKLYVNKTIIDRTYGYDNNLKAQDFPSLKDMLGNGEKAYLIEDLMLKGAIHKELYKQQKCTFDDLVTPYKMAEQILDAMAYDHVEESTKVFWRKTAKDIYFQLMQLLIKNGNTEEAFLLSEKSKYVILEEHLRKLNFSGEHTSIPVISAYQKLIDSIKEEEVHFENLNLIRLGERPSMSRLVQLRNREDDLLDEIRLKHPAFYDDLFGWRKPDLKQLQNFLKREQAVLIEYFLHDSMSYVFVVNDQGVTIHELGPRTVIEEKTKLFLRNFEPIAAGNSDIGTYEDRAHSLFRHLINKKELDSAREILIVPDGVLTLLPFEVLIHEKVQLPQDYNALEYLLKWKPIRYVINAKSVYDVKPQPSIENEVVSFAPDFSLKNENSSTAGLSDDMIRGGFTPLSGAKNEIESLCALFRCRSYTSDVGERLFYNELSHRNGIIHVATHAVMNDSVPSHSKLIMQTTPDDEFDNQVHLFELKNKRIRSNLVILSACNTGVGKMYHGEGLASLGIAFNYAGSPNLITSLWSIPDKSSAIVMQSFYQNLKDGLPKHHALRNAKLDFLKNHASDVTHPYYWGGLLYYGDGNALQINHSTSFLQIFKFALVGLALILFLGYIYRMALKPKH